MRQNHNVELYTQRSRLAVGEEQTAIGVPGPSVRSAAPKAGRGNTIAKRLRLRRARKTARFLVVLSACATYFATADTALILGTFLCIVFFAVDVALTIAIEATR